MSPCSPAWASSKPATPTPSARVSLKSRRNRSGDILVLARARRHPHERREPARQHRRPCRWVPADRALAQRPGRRRLPALFATRSTGSFLEIAELQRALAAARSKAGPHPFAVGSARHVRPSSARLCRNVGARRRALQGRPQAPQRVPARRRRASFPIDRTMTAHALGFDRPTANSLDSVADRNFALEALSATAITATHLSRFAEEIVLWTTPQFASAA